MSKRYNAREIFAFLFENSLLLMIGAGAGLIWANVSLDSYGNATHALEFIVNDVGMVFFFGLAAKEVYEAMLPGGPLSSPREGAVPVFAAVGGMAAPASIYLAAIWFLGRPDLHPGWAIPCATDIAFSYLVSRAIFKPGRSNTGNP